MDPHDCISTRLSENVISWQDVKESGYEVNDEILNEIERKQAVNKVCMLQFTSGTTGPPKGNLEFCSTYLLTLNYLFGKHEMIFFHFSNIFNYKTNYIATKLFEVS